MSIRLVANDERRFSVAGMAGVAFWYDQNCPFHDDCVLMVMVGDSTRHHVQLEDLKVLEEGAYCSNCGQVGCGWG